MHLYNFLSQYRTQRDLLIFINSLLYDYCTSQGMIQNNINPITIRVCFYIYFSCWEEWKKLCVYSSSWISWMDAVVYFFSLLKDWMRNSRLFQMKMKKQLVLIYLLWWLLFLIEWDALDSCKLIWCYIERMKGIKCCSNCV